MEHDEEWLKKIWSTRTTNDYNCGPSDCRSYHEHMMRWRPTTDLPEHDKYIQIIGRIKMRVDGKSCIISHIKRFNHINKFEAPDVVYLGWRPASIDGHGFHVEEES